MEIKRFYIYLTNLNPTQGRELNKVRPVIVVSKNDMNQYSGTVVVCPLTTTIHPTWRSRIQISCAGKKTEIAVDQIRTISKVRIEKEIDRLTQKNASLLKILIEEMYC